MSEGEIGCVLKDKLDTLKAKSNYFRNFGHVWCFKVKIAIQLIRVNSEYK